MPKTRYLSRVTGELTRRLARAGYTLSRRISGRPPERQERREILRQCLPGAGSVLVDVGANVGQFAARAFEVCPAARVLSIEPNPDAADACQQRFQDRPGYELVQTAVGSESARVVTLNIHPYSQASSLLALSETAKDRMHSLRRPTRRITVPLTTLDELLHAYPDIHEIDLLKIDVEGFEADVLRGAVETLTRTRHLLVEAQIQPMHEKAACFDEVCHLVRSAGFSLWMVFESVRDHYGELLIFDLLFRRSPSEA